MGLHPDFPLFPHQSGYWAKKVRGRIRYYGKIADDPKGEAALIEWDRVKDARLAGREPRPKVEGITVGELCDRFLQGKELLLNNGEIARLTFRDYKKVTDRLVTYFDGGKRVAADLGPDDFTALRADYSKRNGMVSLANFIQRVRSVFNSELTPSCSRGPSSSGRYSSARPRRLSASRSQRLLRSYSRPVRSSSL